MATYEEYMAAARRAHEAGNADHARQLVQAAKRVQSGGQVGPTVEAAKDLPNIDGTFGEAPEGMVFDPNTGGYVDVALPHNRMYGDGAGQAAMHGTGQGVSFGTMDEVVGALNGLTGPNTYGEDYAFGRDRMRAELDLAREENPAAAYGSEVVGALMVPGAALKGLKSANTLTRAATGAGLGATQGGLYGFAAGEGGAEERLKSAATTGALGAGVGGSAPYVGKMLGKIIEKQRAGKATRQMLKNAPSAAEDRAIGNALYKQIDDAGVQIKPEAFNKNREAIVDALRTNTGFDELPGPGSLTPNSARVMQIMQKAGDDMAAEPTAALPYKSLDQMRRQAGGAAGNVTNKADQRAGMEIIEGLDDFVNKIGPDDVVAGDVSVVQALQPKARETWSRMLKTQMIEDAIEAGQGNYLSGPASGIRNQIGNILRNKKLSKNFTEDELAAMRRVLNGSGTERVVNLLGGGLGQLGQMGIGAGIGGVPGAILGTATAAGTRKAAEKIALKNADKARALVASGGNLIPPQIDQQTRLLIEAMMRGSAKASGAAN